MDLNIFEACYRLINTYNRKTSKPRNYGTDDLLYPAEVHLLDTIGNHGNITATELAEIFGITKGAVSQTTGKLIKKQLIIRTPSDTEKNAVDISLSDKGRIVYHYHRNMHSAAREKIDNILDNLSPDGISAAGEIISALDELLENM